MSQEWGHAPSESPRGEHPRRGARGHPPGRRGHAAGTAYRLGRAAAVLLLLAAPAAAVVTPAYAGTASDAPEERDTQLVYCLDAKHRGDLVTAAIRLGLLRPDVTSDGIVRPSVAGAGSMTLEQWTERREEDFGRACSALMAAASDSPGTAAEKKQEEGWFETFVKSLPLLAAGALLTLGGQFSERVSSERRQRSQQLSSHEAAFRAAVREYLAAYESDPRADHTAVATAREALRGVLSQVSGPATRRTEAQRLAEGLPLARPLPAAQGGGVLGTEGRARLSQEVRESVETHPRAVMDINRRSLYWRWRALRERSARTAPHRG
ncbi:hypothetical protein [Streptomyces roseoverticillatus]|uniref:Uncharacterized protein n=1 Tax=Streptomyces roseoverticillatus TaxID=66429 RepID=A0ABV3ITY2_9ACTN